MTSQPAAFHTAERPQKLLEKHQGHRSSSSTCGWAQEAPAETGPPSPCWSYESSSERAGGVRIRSSGAGPAARPDPHVLPAADITLLLGWDRVTGRAEISIWRLLRRILGAGARIWAPEGPHPPPPPQLPRCHQRCSVLHSRALEGQENKSASSATRVFFWGPLGEETNQLIFLFSGAAQLRQRSR